MITCDLCDKPNDCQKREIDGKEYDICFECWEPLAQRLEGKGREKRRETVFLPPRAVKEREEEEPKRIPGEPPIIQGEIPAF